MRNNQQNGELEFMEPNDEALMTAYQQEITQPWRDLSAGTPTPCSAT